MISLILEDLLREDQGKTFENALNEALHQLLPYNLVSNKDLTVERLVGMQSGMRDYWALTVLWGATPGDRFSIYQDLPEALKRLGDFHFAPGTQMSYSNTNFIVVGIAIEKATGQTLGDLLESRLFKPAGMTTAALRPDTERLPPSLVGYEGSEESGYIAYRNRIEWAGDAGILASLEDMIAYEKYIDRSWSTDPQSAYFKTAQEPRYADGATANYGHGLAHGDISGMKTVGHGGALPGFSLNRMYVPEERISVVVLLNSFKSAGDVVEHVLKKIVAPPPTDEQGSSAKELKVGWTGHYLDEDSNLAIVVEQEKPGELGLCYARAMEKGLKLHSETEARSKNTEVRFENGSLSIRRPKENRQFTARPLTAKDLTAEGADVSIYTGVYRSEEVDSILHITSGGGGMLYGYFDGYLGQGPAHLMHHLSEDVWYLACHRSLDHQAPGNWTVVFRRSEDGKGIGAVTVGCWLARNIQFVKKG